MRDLMWNINWWWSGFANRMLRCLLVKKASERTVEPAPCWVVVRFTRVIKCKALGRNDRRKEAPSLGIEKYRRNGNGKSTSKNCQMLIKANCFVFPHLSSYNCLPLYFLLWKPLFYIASFKMTQCLASNSTAIFEWRYIIHPAWYSSSHH